MKPIKEIIKNTLNSDQKITRKEAIKKVGYYSVFTASTMMLLLNNPTKAKANDTSVNPASSPAGGKFGF